MKKPATLVLTLLCILTLAGCARKTADVDAGALPPMLTMNGETYLAKTMPIAELPDDFEYMGELTSSEANNTGLEGCNYYANKYISSFDEFYVYQECGTPISENTVDNTQRQWAYVKWERQRPD